MHLPVFIAKRYLFSKNKRNVINIISVVSAAAIGLGCMALIIILSVYNGFDSLIASMYENHIPDFVIEPAKGKTLETNDNAIQKVKTLKGIFAFCPVIEENVFLQYGNIQSIATIKGVPDSYSSISKITSHTTDGSFSMKYGESSRAVAGQDLANRLRLKPEFTDAIELYFPSRTERFSTLVPTESLNYIRIHPGGIINLDKDFNLNSLFIPIDDARNLIEYDSATANKIEIYLSAEAEYKRIEKQMRAIAGDSSKYILKDRWQQNETLYKMMRSEKFAVYLILFFVIIIVSVNIFASLSLLVLDKQGDIDTFRALGAKPRSIRRAFALHGWMVCMTGAAAGLAIGIMLCFIQQHWGVIPMPGNYLIKSYPVDIRISDIAVIISATAIIGFIMSSAPARAIKN